MPDIYDEAIADRKRLLEVAETNAKNKIVDAITPRIKELVENALLGKLSDELGDDDDIMSNLGSFSDELDMVQPDVSISVSEPRPEVVAPVVEPGVTLPDQEGKVTIDIDAFLSGGGSDEGSFELTPESVRALNALVGTPVVDVDDVGRRIVKLESKLVNLVSKERPTVKDREESRQLKLECKRLYANVQASRDYVDEQKLLKIENRLENIYDAVMENYSIRSHLKSIINEMQRINKKAGALNSQITESRSLTRGNVKTVATLMSEVNDLHGIVGKLYEMLDIDDDVSPNSIKNIEANLAALYTEIKKMVTKNKKQINEADELEAGAGAADGVGDAGMDMDMDMEDEEMGAESAGEYLLQLKLPMDLASLTGGESVEVVSAEPAPEESGDDDLAGLDDMGIDMDDESAEDEEPVEDDTMGESDMFESHLNDDDIIEIDEGALVAEMRKLISEKKAMKAGKKVGTAGIKNVNTGGHGAAHFEDFGGGKDEGDLFADKEDLNVNDPIGSDGYLEESEEETSALDEAEEEGSSLREDEGISGTKRGRERQKREMGESRQNASAKNGKLKELSEAFERQRQELAEQKLFNTKIVALNRVLQVPGLSRAQKEQIVETLDKGRTVAEVGKLYTKIAIALNKKMSKRVDESAGAQGSSSRVIKSGAPSGDRDSNPLLEKWSKIAFGNSGLLNG